MISFISYNINISNFTQISTNLIQDMISRQSTTVAHHMIEDFDEIIWNNIALKAIQKMPKYKLSKQTNKIINDFTKFSEKINIDSGTTIIQEKDPDNNPRQNYIVGTSKLVPQINRLVSQQTNKITKQSSHKSKKRVKTGTGSTMTLTQQNITKKSNNNIKMPQTLFKLTLAQNISNLNDEDHNDDNLRLIKEQDFQYNKQLQQKYRQLRARSMQFSKTQKQKYKEIKKFTYDYQGKIVSLKDKNQQTAKIVSIKTELDEQANDLKKNRKNSKPNNHNIEKIQQIINKRAIKDDNHKVSFMEARNKQIKQKQQKQEQERIQKMAKYIKSIDRNSNNFSQVFKERNQISSGVCIIDKYSNARLQGFPKDNVQGLSLLQFKSQTKGVETFKQKLLLKKPKNTIYTKYKTQYTENDSHNKFNLKSLRSDKQSNLTSLARYIKNKGKIIIKDERLYTQNFIDNFQ